MKELNRSYPEPEHFWSVVARACEVFRPHHNVEAQLSNLRVYAQNQAPPQQLLFYHNNPLKVASLLADFELSEDVVAQFCDVIAPQMNWV